MLNFGMIYTIGHTANYRAAFDANKAEGKPPPTKVGKKDELEIRQADGSITKEAYPGGSVWQTRDEAERWIREEGVKLDPPWTPDTFCAWGVDADWEKDTEPDPNASYHNLLKDSPLIDIYA